jgi:Protein of unknown function (DUF4231)
MVDNATTVEKIGQQSAWYGERARRARSRYVLLKGTQIVFAAAIPVIAVAAAGNVQRWTTAVLGALIGIIEGFIQLGQYQQNWLLYRATREALKREEFLYSAKAGPYTGAQGPDTLYAERCDAIVSGENSKWLTLQEQSDSRKDAGKGAA